MLSVAFTAPWLGAFRQSGYALLTPRHQPGNPCNTISKNSGLVGNCSCRQWGIIIVVDGSCPNVFLKRSLRKRDVIGALLRPREKFIQIGCGLPPTLIKLDFPVNHPPNVKSFLVYSSLWGILSQHDDVRTARAWLEDSEQWDRTRLSQPHVYQWSAGAWKML